MQIKLSVIIATYNRNRILCNTIQQVLDQSFEDYELIVVDQTKFHNKETNHFFKVNSSRIQYYYLENPNLPAARNYGVSHSKGEIILYIDDDMLLPSDTFKKLVGRFEDKNIGGLTGLEVRTSNTAQENIYQNVDSLKRITTLPGFFMAYRRSTIFKLGGFDEWFGIQKFNYSDDSEFCIRVMQNGYNLFIDKNIKITHLAHKTGGCGLRENYIEKREDIINQQLLLQLYSLKKNRKLFSQLSYYLYLARLLRTYLTKSPFNKILTLTNKFINTYKYLRPSYTINTQLNEKEIYN